MIAKWMMGLMVALSVTTAVAADKPDAKPDMHGMAAEISTLEKYLVSDAEFGAPKNQEAITKSLDSINGHLDHLSKGTFAHDPALKANLSLLRQHFQDAKRAFAEGNKPFSRYMLQSSLQMCIACHTREKAADFALPELDAKNVAPNDLADYYFATRQFGKGKEVYEKIVDEYPANAAGQWNLRRALLSLAVYYARIKEDPKEGEKYFKLVAANDKIPAYVREESAAWAKEFGKWAATPVKGEEKLTEQQLLQRAEKLLKGDDLSLVSAGRSYHVLRLRASALLHRVLDSPGDRSPAKATALLYLGQIYPRIASNVFFRFGDTYLKACITDYPHTSAARACYVALELNVTEGYTGSAGTDIPEDEQVELMRMKKMAY